MKTRSTIITVLLFTLTIATVFLISERKAPAVIRTNLENIPIKIGNYTGVEDFFDQSIYDELNADRHVYRHYSSPDGTMIDLYIGYYGTAKGGRTGHNPYACLPSSGWTIVNREKVNLFPSYQPEGVELNYLVSNQNKIQNHMLHWYQSDGTKVLKTGFQQNVNRFLGRVLRNRNDGAFVQVSMLSTMTDDRDVRSLLEKFAFEVLELLPTYWPEEDERQS